MIALQLNFTAKATPQTLSLKFPNFGENTQNTSQDINLKAGSQKLSQEMNSQARSQSSSQNARTKSVIPTKTHVHIRAKKRKLALTPNRK